jgi:hypothetical protein
VTSSAGTWDSKSCSGARSTPPFSSVPTYGSEEKSPSTAEEMVSKTAVPICLMTEVMMSCLVSALEACS